MDVRKKSAKTFRIASECIRLGALSMYDSRLESSTGQEVGEEVHRQIQEEDIQTKVVQKEEVTAYTVHKGGSKPKRPQKTTIKKEVVEKEQIIAGSKVNKKVKEKAKKIVQKSNIRENINQYKTRFESYELDPPIYFGNFYGAPDYVFKNPTHIHVIDLKTSYNKSDESKDVIQLQVYMYILTKSYPDHEISGELLYVKQNKALEVPLDAEEISGLEKMDKTIDDILNNPEHTEYHRKERALCTKKRCPKLSACYSDSDLVKRLKSGEKISLGHHG